MSDFQRNKYIVRDRGTIDKTSYVAGQIESAEKFEKMLASLDQHRLTSYERKNKDLLIDEGIKFAYNDINLIGMESFPDEYKNIGLFARGYQVGLRRINAEGYNHCKNGLPLESAELKDHLAFIEGYNNGLEKEKGHKHR